jgi:hypothetical protein
MLSKLQAYNLILAATNEPAIDSLTNVNTYVIGRIDTYFELHRLSVLSHGFTNNTVTQTLQPDIDGKIAIPSNFLVVRFPIGHDHLTVNNNYVWNTTTQAYHDQEITVRATLDTTFENLPMLAQMLVVSLCAKDYRLSVVNEVDSKVAYYSQEAQKYFTRLQNAQPSSNDYSNWGRVVAVYGTGGF